MRAETYRRIYEAAVLAALVAAALLPAVVLAWAWFNR